MSSGFLNKNDLRSVLFPSYPGPEFDRAFAAIFKTNEGKRFLERYTRALKEKVTGNDVQAMAGEYYDTIKKVAFAPLDECAMVSLLSGCKGL